MTDDPTPTGEAQQRGEGAAGERPAVPARPFAVLLAAGVGVACALALVLFLALAAFGFNGAPYAAVGAAVVGGIVMRRGLLKAPSATQTMLFTACTIGAALAGLWLGQLILSY